MKFQAAEPEAPFRPKGHGGKRKQRDCAAPKCKKQREEGFAFCAKHLEKIQLRYEEEIHR